MKKGDTIKHIRTGDKGIVLSYCTKETIALAKKNAPEQMKSFYNQIWAFVHSQLDTEGVTLIGGSDNDFIIIRQLLTEKYINKKQVLA